MQAAATQLAGPVKPAHGWAGVIQVTASLTCTSVPLTKSYSLVSHAGGSCKAGHRMQTRMGCVPFTNTSLPLLLLLAALCPVEDAKVASSTGRHSTSSLRMDGTLVTALSGSPLLDVCKLTQQRNRLRGSGTGGLPSLRYSAWALRLCAWYIVLRLTINAAALRAQS
jgi:hypothetical protein